MVRSAFFTLHSDLPREGPGEAADVLWALSVAGARDAIRVCDVACGPGSDTATLAEALPEARIEAIDKQAHFVAAAVAKLARFGPRVSVRQGDMAALSGPYEVIWCAGAVYMLGLVQALTAWRSALAPGGHIAFSEPVLVRDPPPVLVTEFWGEGIEVTDLAGIKTRIDAAGYRLLGHRMIIGAPWQAYYDPIDARIAMLRAEGATPDLEAVLAEAAREAAIWRTIPDQIAYALCIVASQ